MSTKIGPNERCPCNSGKKYKKCCGGAGTAGRGLPHTRADRESAWAKLEAFIEERYGEDDEYASDEFWDRFLDREDELPPDMLEMSYGAYDAWFAFDCLIDGETRIIDELLKQVELTPGERGFLEAMRRTTMRLYEVTDTVAGSTITLRDIVEGDVVTVAERSASRSVSRGDCFAARIISRGCSGRPEIERGLLPIALSVRDRVVDAIKEYRKQFLRDEPGRSIDACYRELPPVFHTTWLGSIFEPAIPKLTNTDGEAMLLTRLSFHADDRASLERALDGAAAHGLARSGEHAWTWDGKNAAGADVSLGTLKLEGDLLLVEVNSAARGTRVRELIERIAGAAVRHRATTHEDLHQKLVEAVTARALGREPAGVEGSPVAVEPDVADALVAQHYSRHYRAWVDEPVPALDGRTPREAAKLADLKPRVEELIRGLEGMYERALKEGQPAYDPSWMWADLGLDADADLSHPPPMAHERVADLVPGSAEASRAAAERIRTRASFSDTETVADDDELGSDLELQRFLRRDRPADNDSGQEGARAAPYLPLMVNLDLHRRKVFWVDASLAYMLENTDLDVRGRELRTPFRSFALVFTDRHALSLGERLLSRQADDPLRGQILRVATVYVTERPRSDGRVLDVAFAFDALGADLPSLVRQEVPAGDEASLSAFLESVAPRPAVEPSVRDTSPARGLLRLVLNAILYATSADVSLEVRTVAPRKRPTGAGAAPPSSDSVFFLPGKIDIRSVRQLRELARAPDGDELIARFMVRGHWRRPAKKWTDQRLRWIEPYWKGPDMAAVIEKAYRLKA